MYVLFPLWGSALTIVNLEFDVIDVNLPPLGTKGRLSTSIHDAALLLSAVYALNAYLPPAFHLHFQNYDHERKYSNFHPASIILSSFFVSLSVGLCCRFFISVSTVHQPLWAVIIPIQPNIFLSLFNPNTLHKASPSSINIASPSTFPLIFRLIFSQQLPL